MLDITNFSSLLKVAKQQDQPQKFLVAFIEVNLPKQHSVKQAKDYLAGIGGVLNPIELIEKDPNHLDDLTTLANETLTHQKNWKIALIGCLSANNGVLPNTRTTQKHKETMLERIKLGVELSEYIAFHRNGHLVQLGI
jgi:hypothetical protein